MKLPIYLCILATLLTANHAIAMTKDKYFYAYRELLMDIPSSSQELASLLEMSPTLTDSSAVASIYVVLLNSLFDHPTGFEKYTTVPVGFQ